MSFRMSKDLAHSIALTITKKKLDAIKKLQLEFDKRITQEYEKQIPLVVRKAFKAFPGYIRTTTSVPVHGPGFGTRNYMNLTKTLPEHNSERGVKLSSEVATELKGMDNRLVDMRKQYNEMRGEIEASLIALNSFSRIQKELPEIVKYLPKSTSQALMVNLDKTRELIKTA